MSSRRERAEERPEPGNSRQRETPEERQRRERHDYRKHAAVMLRYPSSYSDVWLVKHSNGVLIDYDSDLETGVIATTVGNKGPAFVEEIDACFFWLGYERVPCLPPYASAQDENVLFLSVYLRREDVRDAFQNGFPWLSEIPAQVESGETCRAVYSTPRIVDGRRRVESIQTEGTYLGTVDDRYANETYKIWRRSDSGGFRRAAHRISSWEKAKFGFGMTDAKPLAGTPVFNHNNQLIGLWGYQD